MVFKDYKFMKNTDLHVKIQHQQISLNWDNEEINIKISIKMLWVPSPESNFPVDLIFKDFQENHLYLSTFQACVNPVIRI